MAAGVVEGLAAKVQRQHVEGLVEECESLLEIDAEGRVLGLEIARADAEDEAPVREPIDGRRRLREQQWISVGQHREIGQQLDLRGHRRGAAEADEGVEGLVPPGREPLRVGRRMLGQREALEARALAGDRELADPAGLQQIRVRAVGLRILEHEAHRHDLLAGALAGAFPVNC